MLLHLDEQGREEGRFTHAGWIQSLAAMKTAQGRFILAGGINNEKGAAMLAVLDAAKTGGAGPPAGAPYRYYLFPRSDVARAIKLPYNQVIRIAATARGFHAYTQETPQGAQVIYEFTSDFSFVGVSLSDYSLSDYYVTVHDRLYNEGKLAHPASNCPEARNPPRPLEWRSGAWHELAPSRPPDSSPAAH